MIVPQKLFMAAMVAIVSAVIAAGNNNGNSGGGGSSVGGGGYEDKDIGDYSIGGGVADNNQPKAAEEDMAAEMATAK
jgi:hypothetical protein